jgi:hypothetical protein
MHRHSATARCAKSRAYANAFVHGIARAAGGARIGITKPYLCVHEIANRLHALAAAQYHPEIRPGEISELVAVAVPALEEEQQYIIGKVGYRGHIHVGWRFIGLTIMNDEAIGECDKARRNLDPCDAIAEMIDIGSHRERGSHLTRSGVSKSASREGCTLSCKSIGV